MADLQAAMRAGNKETYLLTGSPREQITRGFGLCESAIQKIVRSFNSYGVDGLIAKKRTGRTPRKKEPDLLNSHSLSRPYYQVDCSYNAFSRSLSILDNASWHKRKSLNWHFFEPLHLPFRTLPISTP